MPFKRVEKLRNQVAAPTFLVFCAALLGAPVLGDTVISVHPQVPVNLTADDTRQLKRLASGVGWEFSPDEGTTARHKELGMKSIRCINVDPLEGFFDANGKFTVTGAARLDQHLATCRAIGANPHIIIAQNLHPDLQVKAEALPKSESIMGAAHHTAFGPTDWKKFRRYCEAYFEYVVVTKGFTGARFEVGNEPDTGSVFVPSPLNHSRGARHSMTPI